MKRVLVTGASGFVGRHVLAPLRARGFEVHAGSRSPPAAAGGARWHAADLLAPGQAQALVAAVRPSHLVHLAWHLPPGSYRNAKAHAPWIAATAALAEAFGAHGGQRFLGVGTGAEYAPTLGPCVEGRTPLAPADLYGRAKDAARGALEAHAPEAGFSAAWARLFQLHGPHEPPSRLVPSVALALLRGKEAPCSPGTQVRDYLHVEDAADALAALLDSPVTGAVNVASGEGVEVRDVARRVAALIGRTDLLRLGARPADPSEPAMTVADVTRLRSEVGWKPAHGLDAGLARTVAWWAQRAQEPA